MDIRRGSPGLTRNAGVREYFMHIHRAGPWWQEGCVSPRSFLLPAVFSSPSHGMDCLYSASFLLSPRGWGHS